jgi:hypothetical protein
MKLLYMIRYYGVIRQFANLQVPQQFLGGVIIWGELLRSIVVVVRHDDIV